jgi:protein-tyrosine-phosphatase
MMLEKVRATIENLLPSVEEIPSERKDVLDAIEAEMRKTPRAVFVCTHNSRRSQLSQVWAQTAAAYFNIDGFEAYSAGTEATAFNHHAIDALRQAGFEVDASEEPNPKLSVVFDRQSVPITAFSKTLEDDSLPGEDFVAVMTCSDAERNCPFVPGAKARLMLRYEDPKKSDGTGEEAVVYGQRSRQIATEMLYIFRKLKN